MKLKHTLCALGSAMLFTGIVKAQDTIYVDSATACTGGCTQDGSDWAHAYDDLQEALAAVSSGDEIWVAEGTYFPTSTSDRSINFQIPSGTSIYGGFYSGATFAQRDPATYETVFSGDIDENGILDTNNSYNVFRQTSYLTADIVIDGVTITMGYANGSTVPTYRGGAMYAHSGGSANAFYFTDCIVKGNYAADRGGGLFESATYFYLDNCIIEGNTSGLYGGGMYIWGTNGRLNASDCQFLNNSGSSSGGGIYVSTNSRMNLDKCSFDGNSSGQGVAIHNNDGVNLKVTNSIFKDNASTGTGSMIYHKSSDKTFTVVNCAFANNSTSATSGSCYKASSSASNSYIQNSIFYNNTGADSIEVQESDTDIVVSNCLIEGGWAGTNQTGVIDANPLWVGSNLKLTGSSPAKDQGDSTFIAGFDEDFDGHTRVVGSNVDMGPNEHQCALTASLDPLNESCSGSDGSASFSSISGTGPYTYEWSTGSTASSISILAAGSYWVLLTDANGCNFYEEFDIEQAGSILYVNVNTPCTTSCTQDGSDWGHAYADLQDALAVACSGNEVWVAAGTYYPTSGSDRTIAFEVPSGISIYGGFDGTETANTQADPSSNVTILSGDIDQDATLDAQNSYTVVYTSGSITDDVLLDGLTIQDGYANGTSGSTPRHGGGLYLENNPSAAVEINECMITNNYATQLGGGLYSYVDITLTNCTLSNNQTDAKGGAMHQYYHTLEVTDCVFEGNFTNGTGQAACIFNNGSQNSVISSCLFKDNDAYNSMIHYSIAYYGLIVNSIFTGNESYTNGMIHGVLAVDQEIVNCSFYDNETTHTSTSVPSCISKSSHTAAMDVYNSIFWDNISAGDLEIKDNDDINVEDCIVQGGWPGTYQTNVLDTNPQWTGTYLELTSGSPAIDAGVDANIPGAYTGDFDGDARFFNSTSTVGDSIDLGAQEYQSTSKRGLDETYSDDAFTALEVYPNPTTGLVNFHVPSTVNYQLFDAAGRVMLSGTLAEGPQRLDLSAFDDGLYHLVMDASQQHVTIIKM